MSPFLPAVWGDTYPCGELRVIRNGDVKQFFFRPDEGLLLREYAEDLDDEGYDVYYGVLPRLKAAGADGDAMPTTRVLWQDIDIKHIEGGHVAALLNLQRAGIDPSILVDSGNGLHAYHLLQNPVTFERARAAMKGMAKVVGGDHTWNASRVLRLPGTHNHKSDPPKPVRLLHFEPERRYRFSDFDQFIEPEPIRESEYHGEGWELSHPDAPKFGTGERNNGLTRLAGIMRARGMGQEDMLVALAAENKTRCNPPLNLDEVVRIVKSVARYDR